MRILPEFVLGIGVMPFCQSAIRPCAMSTLRLTPLVQLDHPDGDNLIPVLHQLGHEPVERVLA